MSDGVKIILVIVAVVLILVPVLPKILPKPMTFERIKAGFEAAGLPLTDYAPLPQPGLEAVEQVGMYIGDVRVDVYHYDDEGKIAKQLEYQKKDAGTAIVETWNLAQSLGAAPSRNLPSMAARRGRFMAVATGPNEAMVKRVIEVFRKL